MNDDIAKRMVERLCLTPPFARLPVTNRPMEDLWQAVDQALMPCVCRCISAAWAKSAQAGGL